MNPLPGIHVVLVNNTKYVVYAPKFKDLKDFVYWARNIPPVTSSMWYTILAWEAENGCDLSI